MPNDEPLAIYLNDHLAGATAGRDLAEEIRASAEGTELGTFMGWLVREIEADRETLVNLMRQVGIETSSLKQVAGTVLEKLSRIKFHPGVEGSKELGRLLQLESLGLGIAGKQALWQALKAASATNPRLAELPDIDLEALVRRAQDQLEKLEPHRLNAAAGALDG